MQTIDLSGAWQYQEDAQANYSFRGEKFPERAFLLPGSTCENRVGKKQEYYDHFSREAVQAPRERYEYIAPIWLQKEVDIPKEVEGKSILLFLERVNIASELWIDDTKIDRQRIELSTPHVYDLTGKLDAGRHLITLRIDNRNLLNLGDMASGYSIDTQGYWNGIIGRIELQYEEKIHIDDIQIYPEDGGIRVKMVGTSDVYLPLKPKDAVVELSVTTPDGRTLETKREEIQMWHSKDVNYFYYPIENVRVWNEFDPALYTLHVTYRCDGKSDEKAVRFGMRIVRKEGKRILLNDRPISLRGTTDCALFPDTGYPSMEIEVWRKRFEIIKEYGLNHVRFHAWCPPECAFRVADEMGLYLSVEMPLWLNYDVCPLEVGDDSIHRQYFMQEALAISKNYGNHPSFLMFSNGNENLGDFELLNDITTCVKAYDPRRLYTLTSNFEHPVLPCEDYFCAFRAAGRRLRLETLHDKAATSTSLDYEEAVAKMPVPILSFEMGQYCMYPDVNVIEQYNGNMLPVNFDAIQKNMEEKGVLHRLSDYVKASGEFAVRLYKEDIEAVLRTKNMGGFQLLSLTDYTGQKTATVGILDVQFRSKGLITPKAFREFCDEVVPLFKAKRILTSDEVLEAELDLYDFGKEAISDPEYCLTIFNGKDVFYECKTKETKVQIPLTAIKKSTKLTVSLEVNGHKNQWRIFVYVDPRRQVAETKERVRSKCLVPYIHTRQELEAIKLAGGYGIVTRECFEKPVTCNFTPAIWSPAFYACESHKFCGAMIDNEHPVFAQFPTDRYLDYQWQRLIDHAMGENLSSLSDKTDEFEEIRPLVEMVPNFVDNTPYSPLFEAKVGNAKLIFCGFDLDEEYPEARQLKASIEAYVSEKWDICKKEDETI